MANKKRLIDANVLNSELIERQYRDQTMGILHTPYPHMRAIVANQPTVDAVEVVHGRWNESDWSGINIAGCMACSNCNVMIPRPDGNYYFLARLHYCPNCGAKMDLKGD